MGLVRWKAQISSNLLPPPTRFQEKKTTNKQTRGCLQFRAPHFLQDSLLRLEKTQIGLRFHTKCRTSAICLKKVLMSGYPQKTLSAFVNAQDDLSHCFSDMRSWGKVCALAGYCRTYSCWTVYDYLCTDWCRPYIFCTVFIYDMVLVWGGVGRGGGSVRRLSSDIAAYEET